MSTNNTSLKGTTKRPKGNITTPEIDYISIVEYGLNLDSRNRINPNSLLYRLALKQWFSNIKGSTDRLELPKWFCGWPGSIKIFTNISGKPYMLKPTVDYYITELPKKPPTEEISPLTAISLSTEEISAFITLDDVCLEYGIPGSYGYTLCLGPTESLSATIDWATAFYSVISAAILTAEASGSGESGGEEETDGGGGGGTSGGGSIPPNANISLNRIMGYGYVNRWIRLSENEMGKMADALAENSLTVTHVELLSNGAWGYYDDTDAAVEKFKIFVRLLRGNNIITLVNMMNWNKGDGRYLNGGPPHISKDNRYNMEWFKRYFHKILDEIGTEKIILQAASEWSGSKAESFHNYMYQNWPGMMSYNKGSRPTSSPPKCFLEFHPFSTSDIGPNNCIITTDTGNIIKQLSNGELYGFANPNVLRRYATKVHKAGRGFIFYGFNTKSVDYGAISALKGIL